MKRNIRRRRALAVAAAAAIIAPLVATSAPSALAAACDTPTGATTYTDPDGASGSVAITDTDSSTCKRTYKLTYGNDTSTFSETQGDPRVRTGSAALDGMYALALQESKEVSRDSVTDGAYNSFQPINCSADGTGCFITGENWTFVWTRDVSYAASLGLTAVDPVRMRNTLNFKLSERRSGYWDDLNSDGTTGKDLQIIQDSGTGGSYPNSTDRVSWAVGAQEIMAWLPDNFRAAFETRAYTAISNTIEHDRQVIFDTTNGLYSGESSFLDWRWQTYPQWIGKDMTQVAQSMSLSTNVTHWVAINLAAQLATEDGDSAKATKYRSWADELADNIRTKFWLQQRGQFSAMISSTLDPSATLRYDALGTALVILTGIATPEQAAKAVANYPQTVAGPPVIWPQQQVISSLQPQQTSSYHNEGAWPFITAYMLLAAAKVGNDTAASEQVDAMMRTPMLYGSNYENINIVSGAKNTAMNSRKQLWSIAGMLGMFQRVFFGVNASRDGLTIAPSISAQTRNKYFADSENLTLTGLNYRGRKLNVTVKLPDATASKGMYTVTAMTVNGNSVAPDTTITADMLGPTGSEGNVVVTLGAPQASVSAHAVVPVTSTEALWGPKDPAISSLNVTNRGVELAIDYNGTEPSRVTMDVLRDGVVVAQDIPGQSTYTDRTAAQASTTSYCYTVRLTYTSSGNTSQPSKPACYWGANDSRITTIDSNSFDRVGGEWGEKTIGGQTRRYVKNWGNGLTDSLTGRFTASATGSYLVQVSYAATAVRDITGGVSSGIKMLSVIDDTTGETVARKPIVMSNYGTWDEINRSTFVPANLTKGRTYKIVVSADRLAVNMGYFTINSTYRASDTEELSQAPMNANDIFDMRVLLKEAEPLKVTAISDALTAAQGEPVDTILATVTSGTAVEASDLTASVAWGDGSQDAGAIATTTDGSFTVSGAHTYPSAGLYTATVTVSDGTATQTVTSRVSVKAPGTNVSSVPAITGTAGVGGTLNALVGTWRPAVSLEYQWLSDGKPIAGATGASLAVTAALVGSRISVQVTGQFPDGKAVTETSRATDPVTAPAATNPGTGGGDGNGTGGTKPKAPKKFTKRTTVRITGKAKAKKKLKARIKRAKPGPVKIKITWYVGKKVVKKGSKTLKIKKKWRAKKVRVKVTTSKSGYATTTASAKVRIKR